MSTSAADQRIRGLRPPKPFVDAWTAHGTVIDDERRPSGELERALTVFLSGAECPFTCSFCDLWRYTIDGPTPPGALTKQLAAVVGGFTAADRPDRLKLYNASNFFDQRAVPGEDVSAIVKLAAPFAGVTVESHANTIGQRTLDFARDIAGSLEIAAGLETIHPGAVAHLNKRLELSRFDRAAQFLRDNAIDLRVFVLLGAPYVPDEESVDWTVRTVEHAIACGAGVVAIIPVRGGNGELERLQSLGLFVPPTLGQLEDALDRCLTSGTAVITADLWDVHELATCDACRDARVERLRRINVSGRTEPRVECRECAGE